MGLTLWDVETGKESGRNGHAGSIQAIAVTTTARSRSPPGPKGPSRVGRDQRKATVDVAAPSRRRLAVRDGACADGKELAVAARFGSVRILDPATGELRKLPGLEQYGVRADVLARRRRSPCSARTCTVVLWDAETGKLKAEFVGYDGYGGGGGSALCFAPDGKTIVARCRADRGGGGGPAPMATCRS